MVYGIEIRDSKGVLKLNTSMLTGRVASSYPVFVDETDSPIALPTSSTNNRFSFIFMETYDYTPGNTYLRWYNWPGYCIGWAAHIDGNEVIIEADPYNYSPPTWNSRYTATTVTYFPEAYDNPNSSPTFVYPDNQHTASGLGGVLFIFITG